MTFKGFHDLYEPCLVGCLIDTLGDRSFVAAAPALWNKLPRAVRHSQNVQTFKKALKTHLFRKAYNL